MIVFAHPHFLLLLLLVPFFFLGLALWMMGRRRRLRKFGDEKLVEELMPSWSKGKRWVRAVLFSLAFIFFVIGLSRPQIGARLREHKARGSEIMVVLDVSNSMLAQDYSPNRLERAKLAISRITDRLQEDRIGLIIFAGSSFVQLPITSDYISAKMFLNSISTESVPVQGTAMGDALSTAVKSFSAQSEQSRAIILITDGENHEDDPVEVARMAAEAGVKVYTIGVGSVDGQPIPINGSLLKDKDGNIVVTRLDEETLKEIASAGNGAYVHAGNDEFGLNPIINDIKRMQDEEFESIVFEEYDEQFFYFLGIALFFFVLEMLVGERKSKKRYSLAILLAFSCASLDAQVDRKEVRAGNRQFNKEGWAQSEIEYRKAVVKDTSSFAGNYNLANSLYRQGNFEEAGKSLERLKDSAPLSVDAADYYYNLGNVACQKKDWKTAVDAYRQSLLRNPGDMDAKENYAYAKKMFENQQNGGGDDGQQQNQNQQQNQDQQQNQNQDQNQEQQQDRRQDEGQGDAKISPQQAQQMLKAIQAREKETQDKVNKEKAAVLKSRQKEKNW